MLRLPVDVARALRRRAAAADVTIAEASRHLMQPKELERPLGLLEHVAWLHGRLVRRRDDLVAVFEDAGADPRAVDRAIDVLADLLKEWPEEEGRDYDFVVQGMGQPQ